MDRSAGPVLPAISLVRRHRRCGADTSETDSVASWTDSRRWRNESVIGRKALMLMSKSRSGKSRPSGLFLT